NGDGVRGGIVSRVRAPHDGGVERVSATHYQFVSFVDGRITGAPGDDDGLSGHARKFRPLPGGLVVGGVRSLCVNPNWQRWQCGGSKKISAGETHVSSRFDSRRTRITV